MLCPNRVLLSPGIRAALLVALLIAGRDHCEAVGITVTVAEEISFDAGTLTGGPGADLPACEPAPTEVQVYVDVDLDKEDPSELSWEIQVRRTADNWPAGATLQVCRLGESWVTVTADSWSAVYEDAGDPPAIPFQVRVLPTATVGAGTFDATVTYVVVAK